MPRTAYVDAPTLDVGALAQMFEHQYAREDALRAKQEDARQNNLIAQAFAQQGNNVDWGNTIAGLAKQNIPIEKVAPFLQLQNIIQAPERAASLLKTTNEREDKQIADKNAQAIKEKGTPTFKDKLEMQSNPYTSALSSLQTAFTNDPEKLTQLAQLDAQLTAEAAPDLLSKLRHIGSLGLYTKEKSAKDLLNKTKDWQITPQK